MVILNNCDGRLPISSLGCRNSDIIKCIGELRIVFRDVTHSYNTVNLQGVGTVFYAKDNRIFVITAASNIRRNIKECALCGQYMEKIYFDSKLRRQKVRKRCIKCNGRTKNQIIKVHDAAFRIWKINKNNKTPEMVEVYGGYKEEYVNDIKYMTHPSADSGYDIAIISFEDSNNINNNFNKNKYYKNVKLKNGHNLVKLLKSNQINNWNGFNIFGYAVNHKHELYGMKSSVNIDRINLVKCNKTNEFYLEQQEIDTSAGQSGSSLWYKQQSGNKSEIIFGIHTGAKIRNTVNGPANKATLINDDILSFIQTSIYQITADNKPLDNDDNKDDNDINIQIKKLKIEMENTQKMQINKFNKLQVAYSKLQDNYNELKKQKNNSNDDNKDNDDYNIGIDKCQLKFEKWWCKTVKLKQYLAIFRKNQCNDIRMVDIEFFDQNTITNDLGIKNKFHCKFIVKKVNEFMVLKEDFQKYLNDNDLLQYKNEFDSCCILTKNDLINDIKTKQQLAKILNIKDDNQLNHVWELIVSQQGGNIDKIPINHPRRL